MSGGGEDVVRRAFLGEGPLFEAILDRRTRELAEAGPGEPAGPVMAVLTAAGLQGRWAVPVAAVARVEPLVRCVPLPDQPAAVLGMAMLAGQRWLVGDLDALAAGGAARPPEREGHALLLRRGGVALAVDYAEAIREVPRAGPGHRLVDGCLLLDIERLVAAILRGGEG